MLEARLSKIDLNLDPEERLQYRESIILQTKRLGDQESEISAEEHDYREKLRLFIEMEKLKLISLAAMSGIPDDQVENYLNEENVPDYDLDNLKVRLGIDDGKKKKKSRPESHHKKPEEE